MRKISKLGLIFALTNVMLIIVFAYLDNISNERGSWLQYIMMIDFPVLFFFSNFFNSMQIGGKISPYVSMPVIAILFGTIQWYIIGWFISIITNKFRKP